MKTPAKRSLRWLLSVGLGIVIVAMGGVVIAQLKHFNEFSQAEAVKGYWASLQDFEHKNGHYPKDDAEIGAFFHETQQEIKQAPVIYVAPHDTNVDEVIFWHRDKTIFGVRIGITESGSIVKQ